MVPVDSPSSLASASTGAELSAHTQLEGHRLSRPWQEHYKYERCRRSQGKGSQTVKTDPYPGSLETSTVPPWAYTMAFTRLNPRPSPRDVRLRSPRNRRSQMRGSSEAGIPGPVSRTRRTA